MPADQRAGDAPAGPDSKTIYHVGAWGRNVGDHAILHAMWQNIRRAEGDIKWRPVDCQKGPLTDEWIDEANREADLIIVGGGGLLWNKPELESTTGWQWDYDWTQLAAIEVPIVVYGIGFTEFPYRTKGQTQDHPDFWGSIQELVDTAVLFSVRNHFTRDFLVERLVEAASKIEVISDPALFLPAPVWNVEEQGAPPQLPSGRPIISICWGSDKPDWRWPNGRHSELLFLGRLLDALEGFIRGANAFICLVPHIHGLDDDVAKLLDGELGTDNFAYAANMLPDLEAPNHATLQAALLIYKRSQLVLSMRKHGLLMGASQGRYVFGLGDMPEVEATMQMLGYGKNVIHSDAPSGIMAGMLSPIVTLEYNRALTDTQRFIHRAFDAKVLDLLEEGP